MLALKNQSRARETDQQVCAPHGLTPEENKTVEETAK